MKDNHTLSELLKSRSAEVNRLDSALHDTRGLVAALQIVCWEFCQTTIRDKRLDEIRSAIIGLGNALESTLAEDAT